MTAPFRTYLDLTNTILRELNEVELTSGSFATGAKGDFVTAKLSGSHGWGSYG